MLEIKRFAIIPELKAFWSNPKPPGYTSILIVDAQIREHLNIGIVEVTHPLFMMKINYQATYRVDINAWLSESYKVPLLTACFRQIIKENHGLFLSCGLVKSWEHDEDICAEHILKEMGLVCLPRNEG
jgi:hypothetical protein